MTVFKNRAKFTVMIILGSTKGGREMAVKKSALACTVCGSRNYSKSANEGKKGDRLEVNKFCKYCGKHTMHKETK